MNLIVDKLHVSGLDQGQGQVALILHGWGNDHRTLKRLSDGLPSYRVVAPDLPGFGGSQPPSSAWDTRQYAQFIADLLVKLDIKQVDLLIGHSFGGRISLELAGRKMIDIKRLVLIASHGLPEPASVKGKGLAALAKVGKIMPVRVRQAAARRVGSADYQAAQGVMKETFKQVITQDATTQAKSVTIPTLLIYGANDETTPPGMARKLSELIGGSQLEIVADAGHHPHIDQPQKVLRLIQEFTS